MSLVPDTWRNGMRLLVQTTAVAIVILAVTGCDNEPKSLDDLRTAGKKAFVAQKYDQARDYLGQAVRIAPSDREALYFLGMTYSKDSNYDSALHYLKRTDILYPDDRETNLELYRVAMTAGEADIAADAIEVLINTGDPASKYWEELAHLHVKREKFFLANRYFRLLLDAEPDKPQRYLDASNAAASAESVSVALEIIDSALNRFGEQEEFLLNKALFLVAEDRFTEGEIILRRLVAADTANIGYRVNLAHTLGLQDDPRKRREALTLYEGLKGRVGDQFNIDSLIGVLREQVGQP